MGLLDEAINAVSTKLSGEGGAGSNVLQGIISMIGNPQNGGLDNLLQGLKDKGLGDVVASWVGTGSNLPISPDQLTCALGQEQVQQLAQQAGIDTNTLAQWLPTVIDKLTPSGTVPSGGLLEQGLNLLKSQLSAHA